MTEFLLALETFKKFPLVFLMYIQDVEFEKPSFLCAIITLYARKADILMLSSVVTGQKFQIFKLLITFRALEHVGIMLNSNVFGNSLFSGGFKITMFTFSFL